MVAVIIAFTVKYCFGIDVDAAKAAQLKECFCFTPSSGVKYCDQYVCMFVGLSAHISETILQNIKFSIYLAMARSSSD